MLTLELLRISCAAPEGHRHHDGQQLTERETHGDGARDEEEKVVGQEGMKGLAERDGERAEWRV